MEWINVTDQKTIPVDETIIVEDDNGRIGQAYFNGKKWVLETFGEASFNIEFDEIIRYIILK